jgi:hypothetical protein
MLEFIYFLKKELYVLILVLINMLCQPLKGGYMVSFKIFIVFNS